MYDLQTLDYCCIASLWLRTQISSFSRKLEASPASIHVLSDILAEMDFPTRRAESSGFSCFSVVQDIQLGCLDNIVDIYLVEFRFYRPVCTAARDTIAQDTRVLTIAVATASGATVSSAVGPVM